MAHAQKPDFVFRRNGRVHLNLRGASVQSTAGSRGVRISGSNAGYTMFRGSVKEYWLPTPFASFPFTSPLVRHRVPSHFNRTLPIDYKATWGYIAATQNRSATSRLLIRSLSLYHLHYPGSDNIKVDLMEMGCVVEWIHLANVGDHCWARVKIRNELGVTLKTCVR